MSIKSDRWIRRMAREHGMIEPFVDPGRQVDAQGRRSSPTASRATATTCGWRRSSRSSPTCSRAIVDPKDFDAPELRRVRRRRLHRAAQQLRAGPLGGVLPDPARSAHHLRGQEHLRPLRHHHQRDALRARVGRPCHAGDQQHHAPARPDLRQRGDLPGPLLRGRRGRHLRDQLRRQGRQVPAADWASRCPSSNRGPHAIPPARSSPWRRRRLCRPSSPIPTRRRNPPVRSTSSPRSSRRWPTPGSSARSRSRPPTRSGGPTVPPGRTTGSSGPTTSSRPRSIPPPGGSTPPSRSAIPTTRPIRSGSSGCRWTRTCSGRAVPGPCSSRRRAGSAGPDFPAASTS